LPGKVYSKADSENWRQYWECHEIVPIYELKKESKLKDFVDTTDNPFDAGKSIVGLGNKRPKDRYQKERERLLVRIEKEKDSDIKAEL
jgi:hypothetical protein